MLLHPLMSAIGSRADLSDSLEHGSVTTGIAYEETISFLLSLATLGEGHNGLNVTIQK